MNTTGAESSGLARSFEELRIWQQARGIVHDVYRDFESGRAERDYGFRKQIQNAAVSIMNNIAEGFERKTLTEFRRFLDIAKGSCGEVRSMYYVAEDLSYVSSQVAVERRERLKHLAGGIVGMISHLQRRMNPQSSKSTTSQESGVE